MLPIEPGPAGTKEFLNFCSDDASSTEPMRRREGDVGATAPTWKNWKRPEPGGGV